MEAYKNIALYILTEAYKVNLLGERYTERWAAKKVKQDTLIYYTKYGSIKDKRSAREKDLA